LLDVLRRQRLQSTTLTKHWSSWRGRGRLPIGNRFPHWKSEIIDDNLFSKVRVIFKSVLAVGNFFQKLLISMRRAA
jgi:hypothetical protein